MSFKFHIPLEADLDVDLTQTVALPSRSFNGAVVNRVLENRQPQQTTSVVAPVSVLLVPTPSESANSDVKATTTTSTTPAVPAVPQSSSSTTTIVSSSGVVQRAVTSSVPFARKVSSMTPVKRALTDVSVSTPFAKLFSGCCFSVSGIANPERAELRRKVLECGGQYSHEWVPSVTHLIAAAGFDKVEKFKNAVRDDRTIVTAEFIHSTYDKRCLQPLVVPGNAFRIATAEKLSVAPKTLSSVGGVSAADDDHTVELSAGHAFKKTKVTAATAAVQEDDDGTEEL
jgi:hypothetical protein